MRASARACYRWSKDGGKFLKELTIFLALVALLLTSCGRADPAPAQTAAADRRSSIVPADTIDSVPPYTGTDGRGIPNYARREFTAEERAMLRDAYGVEDPSHLYVSDSTDDGLLKYDPQIKPCRTCYVNSYRIGFISIRRRGESWEQLERRVRGMSPSSFPSAARTATTSLAALDPDIRADVEHMLADARARGFVLRVVATYRSPEREAFLMAAGHGNTHTLTSLHSYGRAIDIAVGDGNLSHAATRRQWIAFRRWVTRYKQDEFRILGTPDKSWDWAHVEIPSPEIGFESIDAALARARSCRSSGRCDFAPHLAR